MASHECLAAMQCGEGGPDDPQSRSTPQTLASPDAAPIPVASLGPSSNSNQTSATVHKPLSNKNCSEHTHAHEHKVNNHPACVLNITHPATSLPLHEHTARSLHHRHGFDSIIIHQLLFLCVDIQRLRYIPSEVAICTCMYTC